MSSTEIKSRLLPLLRFKKQYVYIATEAGMFNADVLAINKKNQIIEFEIKTSYADFLNDFDKFKHALYRGDSPEHYMSYVWDKNGSGILRDENGNKVKKIEDRYLECIPYKFYFVVTPDIKEKVLQYIEANHPQYGVMCSETLIQVKKCKVIKDQKATDRIKTTMALRMSSEIASMKETLYMKELYIKSMRSV